MEQSLANLRQTVLHSTGVEEKVEVNQRHLIDKILARYSAAFTVFRELVQNANDAGARKVEITFSLGEDASPSALTTQAPSSSQTLTQNPQSTPDIGVKPLMAKTIRVRNNGRPFSKDDWNRLKKIAEGNPDENKIGMFGVGFYSLFSVCEEPFVSSAGECIAFYWKGDQLFAKRAAAPMEKDEDSEHPWTTFFMVLRGDGVDVPEIDGEGGFGTFLATSLGFTSTLRSVTVDLQGADGELTRLFTLSKAIADPRPMEIPHSLRTVSPRRTLRLRYVDVCHVQMDAEYLVVKKPKRKALAATQDGNLVAKVAEFTIGSFGGRVGSGLGGLLKGIGIGGSASRKTEKSLKTTRESVKNDEEVETLDEEKNRPKTVKKSIFLRIARGHIDVTVDKNWSAEFERTTKKRPPAQTTFQIIYAGHDEFEASSVKEMLGDGSEEDGDPKSSVFKDLIPFPEQGKIFIGFPTFQSTGCSCHMAAHLIPTVERESIDLVDRCLATWNHEVLCIGGLLSRVLYEDEMTQISKLYKEMVPTPAPGSATSQSEDESASSARAWLQNRCGHALRAFYYRPSTPAPAVGEILLSAFTAAASAAQSLISSHGILPADQMRLPYPEELLRLIRTVPVVPISVAVSCRDAFERMERTGTLGLRKLNANDLLLELGRRTLEIAEGVALLKLCFQQGGILSSNVQAILDVALVVRDGKGDGVCPIGLQKWFLNPKVVPTDVPVPENVLPYALSKEFKQDELEIGSGRRWRPLPLVEWVRFIAEYPDLVVSPVLAEKILGVISRAWPSLDEASRLMIVTSLNVKPCIPTRIGMRKPGEAYFSTVTLFGDLPIVSLGKGISEKLLADLGVRKHVELQLVFDRLGNLAWDHEQLCKYLSSVSLSASEMSRLKATKLFPAEIASAAATTPSAAADDANDPKEEGPPVTVSSQRYCASELFSPSDLFRNLHLPVLAWKGRWKPASEEAKFLIALGLQEYVPLEKLLSMAANKKDPAARKLALEYFIHNYAKRYHGRYRPENVKEPFLQVATDPSILAKPGDVFSDPQCEIMKFPALHPDLVEHAEKFGVRKNPHPVELVRRLAERPPSSVAEATKIFEYLHGRMGDFGQQQWLTLSQIQFIPVNGEGKDAGVTMIKLVEPSSCYFGAGDASSHQDYFDYVDFGPTANAFLKAAGVKSEPSPSELARLLLRSPETMLVSLGAERYLALLRQLASQYKLLQRDRSLWKDLCRSHLLLAIEKSFKKDSGQQEKDVPEEGETVEEVVQYSLAPANRIYLIDDTVLQQIFGVPSCPMESLLESFYEELGSTWISKEVQEQYVTHGNSISSAKAQALEQLIKERGPLLLYDYQQMPNNDALHTADWLKSNLHVREVSDIVIEHTLKGMRKTQRTTACVMQDGTRQTYLFVGKGEVDYFDVASALGRVLFRRCRLNDRLLLATLLSTSLTNLRRKGYPVDRILNIPKKVTVAPPPILPKSTPTGANTSESKPHGAGDGTGNASSETVDQSPVVSKGSLETLTEIKSADGGKSPKSDRAGSSGGVWGSMTKGLKKGIQSQLGVGRKEGPELSQNTGSVPGAFPTTEDDTVQEQPPSVRPQTPDASGPVDLSLPQDLTKHLRSNLNEAVKSCRRSGTGDITSAGQVSKIQESQQNYCDVRPAHSLQLLGRVEGMEVFLDKRLTEDEVFHSPERMIALGRFVDVLKTLAGVFDLAPDAAHVYFDGDGTTVAFNRGRTLFFNFRFYLAYHDRDGSRPSEEAYYFWFVRFCHELAHNFSSNHDADFAFYLASFAEFYMKRLVVRLHSLTAEELPLRVE